jgi:hypothetical protein
MTGLGLIMGRKAASRSIDRGDAETRRRLGDSRQVRRKVAKPRVRVADVANRHRGRRPTKQTYPTASEANETCPQIIGDFSHPIPVLERELDAIEMYLGPLIDKMLQNREELRANEPSDIRI